MSSSHPQYSAYSLPPPLQDGVRLPSIKDLNFPPPGQEGAPTNGSGRAEHTRPRHDASWSRSSVQQAPPPPPQHSSSMPPPHEPPPKSHPYAVQTKPDASYAPQPPPQQQPHVGVPTHNGSSAGAPRPDNSADVSSKRSRSQQGVSASPGRSPHTQYPSYPPQPPPQSYHQGPPQAVPHPPEHPQQPPQFSHQPPPGYAGYPPPPVPQRHYTTMPPPPPPPHHASQPPPQASYPPPAPAEHWQHHPPPPPPAQAQPPPQPFNGYARTMPIVPANVERSAVPNPADAERVNRRQHVIAEIIRHCSVLYGFAHHYGSNPHLAPAPLEIEEMNNHASAAVHLLEELRRLDTGEEAPRKDSYPVPAAPPEEHARPPKRPWEDMAREGEPAPGPGYDAQSTAEADMQIIRNKRQSSTGGAAPGQQKNKYRKRSRATPPGKCHSCNIRETPEWRRGPDGARTLCNACGLHYAKLMRKRDKTMEGNGKAPPIDLQTLRASTASARGGGAGGEHGAEASHPQSHPPPHQSQPPPSPYDQPKQVPPMHASAPPPHPGPYQLMPVNTGGPSGGPPHQMMPPPHGSASAPHSATSGPVPPPPWMTSSGAAERGGYNAEPQSYVRASHPPSHARASPQ